MLHWLGVESERKKNQRQNEVSCNDNNRSTADDSENTPLTCLKPNMNKIQRRSLPKTPDYAQSFKADDSEIIMARSKEGQKLRDFGYEFITGDENNKLANGFGNPILSHKSSKPSVLAKTNERFILPTKRIEKGLNWIGLNLDSKRSEDEKVLSKGSFKVIKPRHSETFDANRIKYDSIFHATSAYTNDPPLFNEDKKGISTPYLSKLTQKHLRKAH